MIRKLLVSLAVLAAPLGSPAIANDRDQFCAGFEEGYKAIKGDMVLIPLCPLAPLTPLGSSPYREGLKAGMAAAR